jgi:ATP-dependent Clp protease ATP-binding subunit ClpA
VESIADLLRGSEGLLKIDCGQFQTDHETAKLIGIPPGYLDKVKTVPTLLGKV